MGTYTLTAADVTTLNEAADEAAKAAKAAAREARKAYLDDAERIAQTLEGYASEAKTFLADVQRGHAQLSSGHVNALAVGMRLLYAEVRKIREKELDRLINTEASEQRSAELRVTFAKLRVSGQLDIEDAAKPETPSSESQGVLAGV